jgi:NAD+ synthase
MSKQSSSDLAFNPKLEANRISKFIRDHVSKAEASGVVVGISGGIDSAVSSYLAVKALGNKKVLGLLLFEDESRNSMDYGDALAITSSLKIKSVEISISQVFEAFKSSLRKVGVRPSKFALGNIKARCRMVFLYSLANQNNLLVLGTGDRSEEEIGYFTKFGDGGVDLQPIAHLYKTQVKILARELGVPHRLIDKPSSPHLWRGHKATDEIPADYPALDKILALFLDKQMKPHLIARKVGAPLKVVRDIMFLHEKSAHKRYPPPSLLLEIR